MRSDFEKMPEISEILNDEKSHFNGDFYVLPFNSCAESFINGAWYAFQHQQSKVDELQRRNQMLSENIKEQGQKLVYQNEVIETQAEKLLGLRDEKDDLQKRVDAVKALIEEYRDPPTEDKTFQHALSIVAYELEQALKGGEE